MGRFAGLPVMMLGAVLFIASQANAAVIRVDSVTAAPGSDVEVDIILATSQGEEVAGTQNDVTFDPDDGANLTALNRCVINPEISNQSQACMDDPNSGPCKQLNRALDDVEGGRRFRGLVLALDNTTLINDPSADDEVVLYTCTFTVAGDVVGGDVIPLACSNEGASDPDGVALDVTCGSGMITIQEASPTPTSTTVPPTVPPTTPPTQGGTNTPTRTTTVPPGIDTDDDGCQVVAPASSRAGWLLLVPVAWLWVRRPRKR
jgi:hypothetical protein